MFRLLLTLDCVAADSHTYGTTKRPRTSAVATPPDSSSESAVRSEASQNSIAGSDSSSSRGSSPVCLGGTMPSSTTKEALKLAIWGLLPPQQPGWSQTGVQDQLLAQHSELAANWSGPKGLKSAIFVALKCMLDEGDVQREEAVGARGGRSYRYTAVRREESTQPQVAGQNPAKAAKSRPDTPDVEHNSATQLQQPRSPKGPQTDVSKPLVEEGLETVLWNKLRPTQASHKHPAPTSERENTQSGNDTCGPVGDSSNARQREHHGKAVKPNGHMSAPAGETQVHATSHEHVQVRASASSGTKGPSAQDPASTRTQTPTMQMSSSSVTGVAGSSTLASRSSICLRTESASSRPAKGPNVDLATSPGLGALHIETFAPDRGRLMDPTCRKTSQRFQTT